MQISDEMLRVAVEADSKAFYAGAGKEACMRRALESALSLPVQPVAWRWKRKGAAVWIYDAPLEWLSEQGDAIDKQPLYANPVPPTKGPEDDLIAARAAAKEAGGEHSYVAVQAALLALRSRPASALPVVGEDALTELAKHRNWELSCGEDPQIEGEMRWQVHSVNGGRNDREWTLIGTGDTPEAAIRSAIIPSVQP